MTTSLPTQSREIFDIVSALVVEAVGEEELFDIEIDEDTSFQDDLELESLEFVVLAGLLKEKWGDRVDFVGWLADMELDEILALTFGDLVGFVSRSLQQ